MSEIEHVVGRRFGLGKRHSAAFLHVQAAGEAVALLRRAVELGVDHVDTAAFYGSGFVNDVIREALAPRGRRPGRQRRSVPTPTRAGACRCARPSDPSSCAPESRQTCKA